MARPTKRINRNFELATSVALHSQMTQKHGAVLVRGGKVIGRGFNSCSPVRACACNSTQSVFMHAEMAAIRNVNYSTKSKDTRRGQKDCYVLRVRPLRRGSSKVLSGRVDKYIGL